MRLHNSLGRSIGRPLAWGVGLVGVGAAVAALVFGQAGAGAAPRHQARPSVTAKPAPHIENFARELRGERKKLANHPSHVPVPRHVDGCDHDYGIVSQCVPWTFPAGTTNPCGWLAKHGLGPLKVNGRDRHRLDTDRDGIACDPGDAGVK